MPPFLLHISIFLGRNIFNVAIATSQTLLGRKIEIWGQIRGQYMEVIYGSFLGWTESGFFDMKDVFANMGRVSQVGHGG